jgi:hypothetical protein
MTRPHCFRREADDFCVGVYESAYMEGNREAHSKVVQMVLPRANEKAAIANGSLLTLRFLGFLWGRN